MRVRYAIGIAVTAALLAPAAIALQGQASTPATTKRASPAKGTVEVGYMQSAKLQGNTIVTVFQVKNISADRSIVGLSISEFWYDKAGNPVQGTGDRQRLRAPLQPGEVATLTLTSPKVTGMATPQYKFEHNYGILKPKLLKTMK
jgi:hypothetical protein